MIRTTTIEVFNALPIKKRYDYVWNHGIHLLTKEDYNRDFLYSVFALPLLFIEVIYNKLNGDIITILSFDKDKLSYYINMGNLFFE